MSGKSRQIKDQLVSILTSLQSGGDQAFTSVLDNPYGTFDGTPTAQVLPGRLAMSRESSQQVDKAPTYVVRVRVDDENTAEGQQAVVNALYDLSDLVMDAIADADQDNTLGSIGAYMMDAELGEWAPFSTNDGIQLVFDINVTITYSRNLQ